MPRETSTSPLAQNIMQSIKDASVQVTHAKSVSRGPARSGYYKVAILLLASAIEAVLHDLIDTKLAEDPVLASRRQTKKYKPLITLNAGVIATSKKLWICEEVVSDFKLDKSVMLDRMNSFAKDIGIIDESLFRAVDRVKIKRNEIHLQSLLTSSRSYDARTVKSTIRTLTRFVEIGVAQAVS